MTSEKCFSVPVEDQSSDELDRSNEELEIEVKQLAEKILEARGALPAAISSALSSLLMARRPTARPLPQIQPLESVLYNERSRRIEEKVLVAKEKMRRNSTEIEAILKKLKNCVALTDRALEDYSWDMDSIPPAFRLKLHGDP